MFDDLTFLELEVLEVALGNLDDDTKWLRIRPELKTEKDKLLRKVNNELYERDERHWADK